MQDKAFALLASLDEPLELYGVAGVARHLGITDVALVHGMDRHGGWPRETARVRPGRGHTRDGDRVWSPGTFPLWETWRAGWPGRGARTDRHAVTGSSQPGQDARSRMEDEQEEGVADEVYRR